jgi:hypothetical protein
MGDFLDHFTAHHSFFNDFRDTGITLSVGVALQIAANAFSELARNNPIYWAGRGIERK